MLASPGMRAGWAARKTKGEKLEGEEKKYSQSTVKTKGLERRRKRHLRDSSLERKEAS